MKQIMTDLPQRKHTRLNLALYQYPCPPCSLVIAINGRKKIFGHQNDIFTKNVIQILAQYSTSHLMPIHIALFMHDHVHICAEASPSRSLVDFMREFKNLAVRYSWQYGFQGSFWQTSFYDHFLRKEERILTVARYILNNPVHAGFVKYWWEYPYWYSNQYTMRQLQNV